MARSTTHSLKCSVFPGTLTSRRSRQNFTRTISGMIARIAAVPVAFALMLQTECIRLPNSATPCRLTVVMPRKTFPLTHEQIQPLANGHGSCLATDRIVIDGENVGFCYRETPASEHDSGWRFFAGDESQEYVENPMNIGLYDVNTVANYDPQIIPFLASPEGSAFERSSSGAFVAVSFARPGEA